MGGSYYSDDLYESRKADRIATNSPVFDHDHKVKTGAVAAGVHAKLDPKGVTRESRDSVEHPNSLPIGVLFDETGSMGAVPIELQKKLPQLMGLLIRKGYVTDPQVLFGGIGDFIADKGPLQVGQFESGLEMEDDMSKIWLEGNGGGSREESYQLGLYFFARHTVSDAWDKRQKKGYLFLIGDEKPYPNLTRSEATRVFGDTIQADIPTEDLVREVQERYHLFFVIPAGASYTREAWLKDRWIQLVGAQNVLMLDNVADVAETIAGAIGICEGTTDLDALHTDLHDVGSGGSAGAVTTALASLAKSAANISKADIPPTGAESGNQRI